MMRMVIMAGLFGASACSGDETVAAYGAGDRVWTLDELDGAAFEPLATVTFPGPGKILGRGPCNTYSGVINAPYPWFDVQKIAVTRMTCPDLAAEAKFFAALAEMSQSEVAGTTMVLRNEAGREMVFTATE